MAEPDGKGRMKTSTALLFACLLGGLLAACADKPAATTPIVELVPDTLVVVEPTVSHLTLLFAGNLMFHIHSLYLQSQLMGTLYEHKNCFLCEIFLFLLLVSLHRQKNSYEQQILQQR